MSTFEASLKKSVLGLGESYESAKIDLFEETNVASEAVQRITKEKARLALRKSNEDPEHTEYTLYVMSGNQVSEIVTFYMSALGYPIKVASEAGMSHFGIWETILSNREDIRKYYDYLASLPDSRLVLRIAFLMRNEKLQSQSEGKN